MNSRESGFGLVEGLLVVVVIALLGFVGWSFMQYGEVERAKNQPPATSSPVPDPESIDIEKTYGTIKGTASYPSEALPEDEEVCAQNMDNPSMQPYCVIVGRQRTASYELKVPAGPYHVYAQTSQLPGYKAYYNEFSKCGNSVDCPPEGHTQYIRVFVKPGEVVEGVDPSDWYATQ